MQKDAARAGEALSSIPRFFTASKNVDRGEFLVFTGGILNTHPELQALEWLPRVPDSQRASFESGLGRIESNPTITQLNEQRELVRADQRTEYFPVLFAEPFEPNKGVLGFDAASRSEALDVMHLARDSGRIASTGAIRFIQSSGYQQGILLYAPVYRKAQASDGIAAKRTNLAGYVVGALRYDVLLENALKGSVPTGLDWLLIDPNAPPANSFLYYHPSRTRGQDSTSAPDPTDVRAGLHFEATIELPGRKWQLLFRPAPAFNAEFASYLHWIILLAGLTLTGLLANHIAVRIQAESSLRRQKNLLASIIENSPMRVFWKDKESRYLGCNSQFACDAGLSQSEELQGRTDFELGWRDQAELYRADDRAVMESGLAKLNFEEQQTTPDGNAIWLRTSKMPLRNEQGETVGVVGIYEDVTFERNAHAHLAESEARFRSIIEASPVPMALNDDQQSITYVNPAFVATFGYDNADIPSLTDWWPHAYPDADYRQWVSTEWRRRLACCFKQNTVFDPMELSVRCKDGKLRYVIASAAMLGVEYGGTHLVILYDITERKQAEANLRISATAFETHESLMITDANSVIIRVNQAFIDETGYTSEEVIGQTPRLFRSGRHDEALYKAMWETISRTGKWQGEVWDRRKNGEIYPKWLTISAVTGVDGVVTHYVGSHIDITERKAAENKIQHLAFYDPLTQLPNRRLFTDRLQQALASSSRSNRQGALLFLDLDNFKTLNDTLGHDIGDLLLQQVAQRLQSCVREGDTVARLGGDEFVVLLENLSEQISEAAEQTEAIGEKILSALNLPYQLAAHKYHSTPSIGATLFNGHQQSMDELVKQADIAMYQSKQAGRNALRFFNTKMQETINSRAALEGELRNALEKQQFHLYYQIQMDSLGRPFGAEVLIRWIHPERGMVSPSHFIPLAEETGLILPIGLWVLDTACARIKAWEQNAHTRDLVLAVNVSAKQFNQTDFVAQVQGVVQRHGINPARLKLELTESMLIENVKEIIATMTTLKKMGIQFSLDDFGTGYSSLQYLQKLPLDQLKIDQSFVRNLSPDPNCNAIVRTIIAMAKGLNVDIIAEGVETEEQQQLLHYLGCDHYQGYLFSKPVPVEQFEALLK